MPRALLPTTLDRRGEQQRLLHRPRAGAGLLLFRGGARSALGAQAADQGRGAADGGEFRQAAGAGTLSAWLVKNCAACYTNSLNTMTH